MSYRPCTLVERSVTPPSLWTGKKLFHTLVGVAPDAASRMMLTATTRAMIRPARRAPDPVRDRGGIDIGFLECCRRAGIATGQQRGLAVRGTRATREGAPDGRIIPEPERARGPNGPSSGAGWPVGRNRPKPATMPP